MEKLRAAGVVVEAGLLREPARELNIGFFHRIERGRPWVRVKLAMSLDGRTALANGASTWITGEAARADVQRWRARSSAILTGSGTVLADNPRLTVRLDPRASGIGAGEPRPGHVEGEQAAGALAGPQAEQGFRPPLRVVLDRQLRTPEGSHVLDGSAPTLMLHAAGASAPGRFAAVECAPVAEQDGRLDLAAVFAELARREVNEVHVEAGPTLCGALFAAGLVDELLIYVAPVLLGDQARPLLQLPALTDMAGRWRLRTLDRRALGEDWRLQLRPA
jgi:diaminohydroxyphosphoribosylaminopyrimidine deaminase / 5-amino-6-(5-phosphoribosylamino)uracil reductase